MTTTVTDSQTLLSSKELPLLLMLIVTMMASVMVLKLPQEPIQGTQIQTRMEYLTEKKLLLELILQTSTVMETDTRMETRSLEDLTQHWLTALQHSHHQLLIMILRASLVQHLTVALMTTLPLLAETSRSLMVVLLMVIHLERRPKWKVVISVFLESISILKLEILEQVVTP